MHGDIRLRSVTEVAAVELEPAVSCYGVRHPVERHVRKAALGPPIAATDVRMYAGEPHLLQVLSLFSRPGLLLPKGGNKRATPLIHSNGMEGTIHPAAESYVMEAENVLGDSAKQANWDTQRTYRIPNADAGNATVGMRVARTEIHGGLCSRGGVIPAFAVQNIGRLN